MSYCAGKRGENLEKSLFLFINGEEIDRLQGIIDSRPAINDGLQEAYIKWSQGIMLSDIAQVIGHDA